MKKIIFTIILLSIGFQSQASTIQNSGKAYFGLKSGQSFIDDIKAEDDPLIYGAYTGYKFSKNFGVEVDYTRSKDVQLIKNTEYHISTYGAYLTYHYPIASTKIYAKNKLGIGGAEIDKIADEKISVDDVGIAGGLGIGFEVNSRLAIEAEFNMLRSDKIDSNSVTLGVQMQF